MAGADGLELARRLCRRGQAPAQKIAEICPAPSEGGMALREYDDYEAISPRARPPAPRRR